MSGSALWYISFKDYLENKELNLKLVGLVTDYHGGADNVVAATNIAVITEAIRHTLEANLPKSKKININTDSE